jgi:hypothetical protein
MSEPRDEHRGDDPRWLDDPRNVTRIVRGLVGLCAVLFLADLLYTKHPHFEVEEWFGFYAVYGFLGSVALVLTAKAMRPLLRRDEDYYERDADVGGAADDA